MIESLHIATGAAVGAACGSPLGALLLGPVVHLAGDLVPHDDVDDRPFEIATAVGSILLLAAARGPLDPATLGGAAAAFPDLEHLRAFPGTGGRKVFPTHRRPSLHARGGLPVWLQLAAAGAILAWLAVGRCPRRG
jgi:hypothetical protein